MLRAAPLFLLVACNQVYGLDATKAIDAQFFDVREDFTCPPIGETPRFSASSTLVADNCFEYSEAAGRAVAFCLGGPVSGPIGGPFVPIAALAGASPTYVMPRLAPENDRLFVRENTGYSVRIFQRTGDDTFAETGTLAVAAGNVLIGVPARGGRMLYGYAATPAMPGIFEIIVAADGSFTPVRTHTMDELQVTTIAGAPNLTPDGLRMTFPGRLNNTSSHMLYADRAQLGDPFGAARPIDNVAYELTRSATLNETCSRIYWLSGETLVWSQRL